jgi:hypothetical protein
VASLKQFITKHQTIIAEKMIFTTNIWVSLPFFFSIIIITQKKKFVKQFLGKNAKKSLPIDEERNLLKAFIYTNSARRARRRAAQ